MELCWLLAAVDAEREELLAVCRVPQPEAEGAKMDGGDGEDEGV